MHKPVSSVKRVSFSYSVSKIHRFDLVNIMTEIKMKQIFKNHFLGQFTIRAPVFRKHQFIICYTNNVLELQLKCVYVCVYVSVYDIKIQKCICNTRFICHTFVLIASICLKCVYFPFHLNEPRIARNVAANKIK